MSQPQKIEELDKRLDNALGKNLTIEKRKKILKGYIKRKEAEEKKHEKSMVPGGAPSDELLAEWDNDIELVDKGEYPHTKRMGKFMRELDNLIESEANAKNKTSKS